MKTLEFIYQENEIHFLLNPTDDHVMVNATEMAKMFNKRLDVFLKTQPTKESIELLKFPPVGVNLKPIPEEYVIQTRGRSGTYFHRELAIEFAMWLDPVFKRWIINKIDHILFGNLKEYRDAMKAEIEAKERAKDLKQQLIANPSEETVIAYFENEEDIKNAQTKKAKAVRLQKTLFEQDFVSSQLETLNLKPGT